MTDIFWILEFSCSLLSVSALAPKSSDQSSPYMFLTSVILIIHSFSNSQICVLILEIKDYFNNVFKFVRKKKNHSDPGLELQQAELQQSGSLVLQLLAAQLQLTGPAVLPLAEAASPAAPVVDTADTERRAAACVEVAVADKEAELQDGQGERSEWEQRELILYSSRGDRKHRKS